MLLLNDYRIDTGWCLRGSVARRLRMERDCLGYEDRRRPVLTETASLWRDVFCAARRRDAGSRDLGAPSSLDDGIFAAMSHHLRGGARTGQI
jgi:hypothetical protein